MQVHNKYDVYKILEKGSEKRKTAETLMNAHSSRCPGSSQAFPLITSLSPDRSHTVFTLTVHIKEASLNEEVLRIGKLYLVDLAGSENIGRSGAKDGRAREAGNINQSLLTLGNLNNLTCTIPLNLGLISVCSGRVISNLVDHAPHIPYRESKLTRLLQDSLGGRTKTSIIATLSPATINVDETLSTLDYASRARSILNRPEINQKLSKSEILKVYSNEMERIRKDLGQIREKNGIYIAKENYMEMLDQIEKHEMESKEKTNELIALKEALERKKGEFDMIEKNMILKSRQITIAKEKLGVKEAKLEKAKKFLQLTVKEKEEQEHLAKKYVETEDKLGQQSRKLLRTNDEIDFDLEKLHLKIEDLKRIDMKDAETKTEFNTKLNVIINQVSEKLTKWEVEHVSQCETLSEHLKRELSQRGNHLTSLASRVKDIADLIEKETERYQEGATKNLEDSQISLEKLNQTIGKGCETGGEISQKYFSSIENYLAQINGILEMEKRSLDSLRDSISGDLENTKKNINESSVLVLKIVEEMDKLVRSHYKENQATVNEMKKTNHQVKDSLKVLKDSLKTMMKSYDDHAEKMTTCGAHMSEMINDLVNRKKPFESGTIAKKNEIHDGMLSLKQKFASESGNNIIKITSSIKISNDSNIKMKTLVNKIGDSSVDFEEEYCETWAQTANSVADEVEKRNQTANDFNKGLEKEGVDIKNKLNTDIDEIEICVENLAKQKEDCKRNCDTIKDIIDQSNTMVEETKKASLMIGDETASLLTTGLNKYSDTATGGTPRRVERQFPRYLAATSPHHRILDRHRRAAAADEAAKLALDNTEGGDSLISEEEAIKSNSVEEVDEKRDCSSGIASLVSENDIMSDVPPRKKDAINLNSKRNILSNKN